MSILKWRIKAEEYDVSPVIKKILDIAVAKGGHDELNIINQFRYKTIKNEETGSYENVTIPEYKEAYDKLFDRLNNKK